MLSYRPFWNAAHECVWAFTRPGMTSRREQSTTVTPRSLADDPTAAIVEPSTLTSVRSTRRSSRSPTRTEAFFRTSISLTFVTCRKLPVFPSRTRFGIRRLPRRHCVAHRRELDAVLARHIVDERLQHRE